MKKVNGIIHPSENAAIQVQNDPGTGGAIVIFRDGPKPPHAFRVSRENAIGLAMALMQAAGVPLHEEINRRQALEQKQ